MKKRQSLRILLLSDFLLGMGGAERNLSVLASQLRQRGHDVLIVALQGGQLCVELTNQGFEVYKLNVSRIYGLRGIIGFFKILRLIHKKNVSVIMTYHESSDYMGAALGLLSSIPVISNRRDMGFKLKRRHVQIYRFINNRFSSIIAVSNTVKNKISISQKVDPRKIVVIPNGAEVLDVDGSFNIFQKYPELDKNGVVLVCCLANIRPIKGHKYLLQSFWELKQLVNNDIHLLLAGSYKEDDPCYLELKDFVELHELEEDVIFVGQIGSTDIRSFLGEMDISVLPSLSEGMSNTLIESMASGLPIVATDVGGNPEVVVDGQTGYLVPPQDAAALTKALLRLIENKIMRQQMGAKGFRRFNDFFTTSTMTDRYLDTIMAVISKNIQGKHKAFN